MKTEFKLDASLTYLIGGTGEAVAKIIGGDQKYRPYVTIVLRNKEHTLATTYIRGKDLRLFAKNILKSLDGK